MCFGTPSDLSLRSRTPVFLRYTPDHAKHAGGLDADPDGLDGPQARGSGAEGWPSQSTCVVGDTGGFGLGEEALHRI